MDYESIVESTMFKVLPPHFHDHFNYDIARMNRIVLKEDHEISHHCFCMYNQLIPR